jgi:putative flippase GtrA
MTHVTVPARKLTPVVRFLIAGTLNTLLSIAVYQAALWVTGHMVAYVIAYAVGILFAYVAYARHVFDAALSKQRFGAFAIFYLASGGIGTLVNTALIEQFALHARVAIFVTVLIMLPVNYAGSRWCVRGTRGSAP